MTRTRPTRSVLPTLCALLAAATFTPSLHADEVVLNDGRVLVGKTRKSGKTLLITTVDGVVRVKVTDIKRIRTDDDLRDALQLIAVRSGAGSCHAQLELARLARSYGLYDEMWRYLSKVLRSAHHSDVMQRRAGEFMAGLEKEVLPKKWRTARPEVRVRELLFRIRRRVPQAKLAAVEELLVQAPDADKHLRRRARRVTSTNQRVASIRALARRTAKGNDRFVYRTAILDGSPVVRKTAMDVSKQLGRTEAAIEYLSPGLVHDNARYRIRTAQAFGELGDAAALPLLVAAGPTARLRRRALPGGATRANMSVITQQAYIRDFDVEVAQASFIADPKVDVLHSGVVLDVTVVAVQSQAVPIVNAYRSAIHRISGKDPGKDPKTWADWLKQQQQPNGNTAPATRKTGVRDGKR